MNAERPALKKAIIFDRDGVLLDSSPYYYEARSVAFATRGITLSKDAFYEREGEQRQNQLKRSLKGAMDIAPSARVSEEIIDTLRDAFFNSFKLKLFPCTMGLLLALSIKRKILGSVTGSLKSSRDVRPRERPS